MNKEDWVNAQVQSPVEGGVYIISLLNFEVVGDQVDGGHRTTTARYIPGGGGHFVKHDKQGLPTILEWYNGCIVTHWQSIATPDVNIDDYMHIFKRAKEDGDKA